MIAFVIYGGFELRAYSTQEFPTVHDPYAKGTPRFSSTIRIDALAAGDSAHHRYQTPGTAPGAPTRAQALDAAIQFGIDIVDGKSHAPCLPH